MPPKFSSKKISVSTNDYRRSIRLLNRLKSLTTEQLTALKKTSTSSNRKGQPAASKKQSKSSKEQPTSSKGQSKSSKGQPTSSKGQSKSSKGQPTSSKGQSKSSKEQPTSSKGQSKSSKGQPTSSKGQSKSSKVVSKENPRKRRRVMKMDEIQERASRMTLEENQDFSIAIEKILKELSPILEISEEALSDMNTYLNHVFERLAKQAAIFVLGNSSNCITIKDIETAIPFIIEGDLGKYCVVEGRSAVKKWDGIKYAAAYQK